MLSRCGRQLPLQASSCTIHRLLTSRAFVFKETGDPSTVLQAVEYELPELQRGHIALQHKYASINPADINTIEGKYPSRPPKVQLPGHSDEVCIPGNEGLAIVSTGAWGEAGKFETGDWVLFASKQSGTFRSRSTVEHQDSVLKIQRDPEAPYPLTEIQAAQLHVNPATAYRMLNDYVDLDLGDWIIQNGANSAVGINVIQLARAFGYKTMNIVRDREPEQLDKLKNQLRKLGANEVVTESELKERTFKEKMVDYTGGNLPKLALNCVSGPPTTDILKHLAYGATVVTYGGMSKQPLSLPSGFLIFKGLQAKGFWLTNWYANAGREERDAMLQELVQLMERGELQAPEVELVPVGQEACSLEEAEKRVKDAIAKTQAGYSGKKRLLQF